MSRLLLSSFPPESQSALVSVIWSAISKPSVRKRRPQEPPDFWVLHAHVGTANSEYQHPNVHPLGIRLGLVYNGRRVQESVHICTEGRHAHYAVALLKALQKV